MKYFLSLLFVLGVLNVNAQWSQVDLINFNGLTYEANVATGGSAYWDLNTNPPSGPRNGLINGTWEVTNTGLGATQSPSDAGGGRFLMYWSDQTYTGSSPAAAAGVIWSKTYTGLIVGKTYRYSLLYGYIVCPSCTPAAASAPVLSIRRDGTTTVTMGNAPSTWTTAMDTFVATATSHTIAVYDANGNPTGNDIGLDDIKLEVSVDVSGTVLHDADGGNVNNSLGGTNSIPSGMRAYLVNTLGNVAAVATVNTDGTYTFKQVPAGTYTVKISTAVAVAGAAAPASVVTPGWASTGEFNGTPNTGNDGTPNGTSAAFTLAAADISNINFGVEQLPVADAKSYNVANSAFGKGTPPGGFPAVSISGTNYHWIPMNSSALTGYTAGGSLTGSDPEDCAAAASCNTNSSFVLNTFNSSTVVYYDFGGSTGIKRVLPGDTIRNFAAAKLMIYAANGTGTSSGPAGFTYSLIDAAGKGSTAATYNIMTPVPLPVQLTSFEAVVNGCEQIFRWSTGLETELNRMILEQSNDAVHFYDAAEIIPKGSNSDYETVLNAVSYSFFRLRLLDNDQSVSYSKVLELKNTCPQQQVTLSPNPATTEIKIRVPLSDGQSFYELTEISGRILLRGIIAQEATLQLGSLPNGIYVLKVSAGNAVSVQQVCISR